MAYTVKCRKCGATLNRDKAFRVVVGKVNTYYCNESEYNNVVLAKQVKEGILSEEQALRAIMNTNIFVDDCEEIVFDRKFKIPSVYKGKTYEEKCKIYKTQLNLAYAKEKNKSKEKVNGIRYEAKEIMDSGVVDYFLTSKKIVEDAVNNEGGILTTTSRGSAASYITRN